MTKRRAIRICAYWLLTGPIWAKLVSARIHNNTVHFIADQHGMSELQYTLLAQKMQIAMYVSVAGIVSFVLGLALLFLSRKPKNRRLLREESQ